MVYSGNLNDFADVVEKIQGLDLKVYHHTSYDNYGRLTVAHVMVTTVKGETLAEQKLVHYDYDVLINTVTSWLRGVYSNLKDWK